MKKKILWVALMSAMSSAYALDSTVDARSLAMGGSGVASANGMNAAYQNPSVLVNLPKERFTFDIPVAIRLLDSGDLVTNLDTLNTNANTMNTALSAFSGNQSAPNATAAGTAVTNFSAALAKVSNQNFTGGFYGGTYMALPRPEMAYALKLDVRSEIGGSVNYATADQATINTLAADLTACGAGTTASCTAAVTQTSGGQINGLVSTFDSRGVVVGEVGLSVARHVEEWAGIDIGITPKYMNITSFENVSNIQSGNTSTTSNSGNRKSESAFNMDVGAAKQYQTEQGGVIKSGVVVKNLLPKTVRTALGNAINIAPQFTFGGSYGNDWFTGSADIDVMKNKAVIESVTKESQFLRMGAEFDALGWAQLRMGYRHDIAGNYPGLPSVGLGLNLKVLHLDMSVAAAGKKEVAAAIQVGTRF